MNKKIYNNLPPLEKLEVVKKWVEYLVDRYPNRSLYRCIASFYNDQKPIWTKDTFDLARQYCKKCFYCNLEFSENDKLLIGKKTILTKDHFIPRSKHKIAYKGTPNPIVLCCEDCNKIKSNMDPSEFISHINYGYEHGMNFKNLSKTEAATVVNRLKDILSDIRSKNTRRYYYIT